MNRIPSDAETIAESLVDPVAFSRVFDRHFVEIHAYVQRRLGTRLADRVAERTFVEAFRERDSYERRGHGPDARPWLYGIATRLVGCHRRREIRNLRAYARRGPSLIGDAPLAARERLAPSAAKRSLARGIAKLDPGGRDTLLLGAWAGLEQDGLARALGCENGEATARLAEARRRVAELAAVAPGITGERVVKGAR